MFERRLQTLLIVLSVVCCVLAVRAVSLQVVSHATWSKKSEEAMSDERQTPTVRGRILDVKGRELAVDQPCIDACVHYFAIAASKDTNWAATTAEGKWLNGIARGRLKKRYDDYAERPLAERKKLLAAEAERVKADIDVMWHDLATLSGKTEDEIDETRRQIVRRVETRRRLLWVKKYDKAADQQKAPSIWARLLGAGQADLDSFDLRVSEERDCHIILPNIDYALRNELARRASGYPGLLLREGVRRFYPYASVAAQTIGYTAKVTSEDLVADAKKDEPLAKYAPTDDIGRDGMEKLFEPQLRGVRGLEATTDTDAGTTVQETPSVPGGDVTTTLDVELQKKVEEAFTKVTFAPGRPIEPSQLNMPGAAVVIDVASGEVRAMASWPTYDLNKFNELYSTLARDQINLPLWNKAIMLDVVPGSTVKPIVGISAISAGVFRPDETIHCNGFLEWNGVTYRKRFRCWTASMHDGASHQTLSNPHPTGYLTFPEALQRSCNVFHEELALRMGLDQLSAWFRKFGLGEPTGIGLPRESAGLLPDEWQGPAAGKFATTLLAGIGEGSLHATPIQMANVAATIARGGSAIRPTLVLGQRNPMVDLHLSRAAVAEARKGMFDVVNTDAGTGTMAWLPDVPVAAKTGSAQTSPLRINQLDELLRPMRDENGKVIKIDIPIGRHDAPNPEAPWYRYTGSKEDVRPAHGWMIGFAPAENPKVAFAVLVEYGGGGGPAAGSVVRKLVEACKDEGYLD